MTRFVVLINFSETGFSNIAKSPSRAEQFRAAAEKEGAKIESVLWTVGPYDGVFVISAPDEKTAAALVLRLRRDGFVRTTMLRAFDADEFGEVLAGVST